MLPYVNGDHTVTVQSQWGDYCSDTVKLLILVQALAYTYTCSKLWYTIGFVLWSVLSVVPNQGPVPIEKCGLNPTSRPGIDPTLNRLPTSMIILGRTRFSSNVGSSLHTWMSGYFQSRSHYAIWYHVPRLRLPIWDCFDPGSSPFISRSHYENMWTLPRIEPMTLQTCQWEHAHRKLIPVDLTMTIIWHALRQGINEWLP